MANPFVVNVSLRIQDVIGLKKVKQQITQNLQGATGAAGGGGGGQFNKTTQSASKASSAINKLGAANVVLQNRAKAADTSVRGASSGMDKAASSASSFGESVLLAGRRYAAFIAATTVAFKAIDIIGDGTRTVIEFDKALIQLSQILGEPANNIKKLGSEINRLAIETGTSQSQLAQTAKILAQTGRTSEEIIPVLEQLAKVPLAPTFESIETATEGAIAALGIFKNEGLTTVDVFDKLTAVSFAFAASSEDIIEGLRRGGASFQAIGGSLDEFIAGFTAIRDTTRESSASIGTFFKTFSSRLADRKILDFLETKGVKLTIDGEFVGVTKAIEILAEKFKGLGDNVLATNEIAKKLAGRRQVSRFSALINNTDKFREAFKTSKNSANAFAETTQEGLEAISVKLGQLTASAKQLAIELGPDLFKPALELFIDITKAAISFGNAIKPLIPIVAQLGSVLALSFGVKTIKSLSALALPKLGLGAASAATTGGVATPGLLGLSTQGAAAGAVAGGIRGTIGKSPFIQAGLIAAAGQAASKLLEMSGTSEKVTQSFLESFASISAAILLFRAQTIKQFLGGGGFFGGGALSKSGVGQKAGLGGLTGGLLSAGALALGVGVFAANEAAEETRDKIIEAAIESVSKIKLDPSTVSSENQQPLIDAVGDFNKAIAKGTSDLVNQFDVLAPDIDFGERFKRVFQSVGTQISNVLEGDFETLIRRSGITSQDLREQFQKILKSSPKLIEDILESVSKSFASGDIKFDASAVRNQIIKLQEQAGLDKQEATAFAVELINLKGGLNAVNKVVIENIKSIEEETRKREALNNLQQFVVPPSVTGELLLFGKALNSATQSVDVSIQNFNDQISRAAGGIVAPTLPTQFAEQDIRSAVSGGNLEELFKNLPNLPDFINNTQQISDIVDKFIVDISESGDKLTGADIINKTSSFLDSFQNVPDDVLDGINIVLEDIATEFTELNKGIPGVLDPGDLREKITERLQNLQQVLADDLVNKIPEILQAQIKQLQRDLQATAVIRRAETQEGISPGGRARVLERQLGRVGERRNIERTGISRKEQERRIANVVEDTKLQERLIQQSISLNSALTKAQNEVVKLEGKEGFKKAAEVAADLAQQFIEVNTALDLLSRSAPQARQLRIQEARDQARRRQENEGTIRRRDRRFFNRRTLTETTVRDERQPGARGTTEDRVLQFQLDKINNTFDRRQERDKEAATARARAIEQGTRDEKAAFDIFNDAVSRFQTSVATFANQVSITGRPQIPTVQTPQDVTREINNQNGFNLNRRFESIPPIPQQGQLETRSIEEAQRGIDVLRENNRVRQEEIATLNRRVQINQAFNNDTTELTEKIATLNAVVAEQSETIGQLGAVIKNVTDTITREKEIIESSRNKQTTTQKDAGKPTQGAQADTQEEKILVSTDNKVNVDLTGIDSEIVEEVSPLLEDAAKRVAKSVVKKALESIASSSDTEASIAVNKAVSELE